MSFKRILALVLALTMCFSIVFPGGVAFAEEGVVGEEVLNTVDESNENNTETLTENTEETTEGDDTTTVPETVIPETPAEEEEEQNEEENEAPAADPLVAMVGETEFTSLADAVAYALEQDAVLELLADAADAVVLQPGESLKVKAGDFAITVKDADGNELTGDFDALTEVTTYTAPAAEEPDLSGLTLNLDGIDRNALMLGNTAELQTVSEGDVAKVGDQGYATIDEAIAAWTSGTTLTLLADVTLSDVIKLDSNTNHTLDLQTYTMTAATNKNAIEIVCRDLQSQNTCLTVNADTSNPGGITAKNKSCIYYSKTTLTKDRPQIYIKGGVFNGSYAVNINGKNGNTNVGAVVISGGTFNGMIAATKFTVIISGGTFNQTLNCTGDSSAYRQFKGGKFTSWQFLTADDNYTKFWVGTNANNRTQYDVGVYVDGGYLVIGGPVITEAGDRFEASIDYSKWSSYLKYSSAAANGLYYTDEAAAFAKIAGNGSIKLYTSSNTNTTVNSGVLTVDASATGASYSGNVTFTGTSGTFTLKMAEGSEYPGKVTATRSGYHVKITETVNGGVVTQTYTLQKDTAVSAANAEAQVGSVYYETVYDAFYAVDGSSGKTIKLLKDVNNATIITNGKAVDGVGVTNVTFDLNGHSIGLQGCGTGNDADYTLTVIDSSEGKTGEVTNGTFSLMKIALTGINDYSGKYTLKVQAGTWQFDPSSVTYGGQTYNLVDVGFVAKDNGNGTWTVGAAPATISVGGNTTSYGSVEDALTDADNADMTITVNEEATIGGITVPANTTMDVVSVESMTNPTTSTTVVVSEVSIPQDESAATVYVINAGASNTAVLSSENVSLDDSITNTNASPSDFVDVPSIIAKTVAASSTAVAVNTITEVEISLAKELQTSSDNSAVQAVITAGGVAIEVHPVATVSVQQGDAPAVVSTYEIPNTELKGATFEFTLSLGAGFANKNVVLTHYGSSGTAVLGLYTADANGVVSGVELSSFSVVTAEAAIASATVSGVLTYYDSLADAVANADAGTVVTLLNDTEEGDIAVTKNVTLDLNGNTMTIDPNAEAAFHVGRNAVLTVTGGGTISSTQPNTIGVKLGAMGAGLVLESGQISVTGAGSEGVVNTSNGSITLNGGSVTAATIAVHNQSTGTVTVNGGSVNGGSAAIYNPAGGTATISGGTITGSTYAVQNVDGGTMAISGGSFSGGLFSTYQNLLPISGGVFTADPSDFTADGYVSWTNVGGASGYDWAVYEAVTVTFDAGTGATVDGVNQKAEFAVAKGKSFASAPVSFGYEVPTASKAASVFNGWDGFDETADINADVTYSAKWLTATASVTHDGVTTNYENLAAAVAAADAGDVVTLLADDYSLADGSEIEISKPITITGPVDGDGAPLYTIYGKNDAVLSGNIWNDLFIRSNTGTVTISNVKFAQFSNNVDTAMSRAPILVSTTNNNVVLDNLYFSEFNCSAVHINGGSFAISNCYIDATKTSGTVYTKGVEIVNAATGSITDTTIVNATGSATTWVAAIEASGSGDVTVTNCTITSSSNYASGIATSTNEGETEGTSKVTVSGCTVTAKTPLYNDSDNGAKIKVSSGSYTGGEILDLGVPVAIAVSGGTFDYKLLEEYCADGYVPSEAKQDAYSNIYYTVDEAYSVLFFVGDDQVYSVNIRKTDPARELTDEELEAAAVAAKDAKGTGYSFAKWKWGSTDFDTSTVITHDYVLTAVFTKDLNLGVSVAGWIAGSTPSVPVVTGNTGNATVTFVYEKKGEGETWTEVETPTTATPAGTYRVKASVPATADGVVPAEDNVIGYSAASSDYAAFTVTGAVATLTHSGATTYYKSLKEAIEAAASGDTVNLLTNTSLSELANIESKTDLVIDLGGNTVAWTACEVHVNKGSAVTIQNGTIDISGASASGDCIIGVGAYNNTANTLTLDHITLTGENYNSAYAVLYAYSNGFNTLNLNACTVTLKGEQSASGGVFKGGSAAENKINITASNISLDDASRGFTTADVTITNSEVAITNCDNGFNGSAVTIDSSAVSVTNGSGRGITAGSNPVVIKGNSTVTLSGNEEGDLRIDNNASISVQDNATLAPTVIKENGTTTAEAAITVASTATAPHALVSTATAGVYDAYADLAAAFTAINADGKTVKLIANDAAATITVNNSAILKVGSFNVAGQITVANGMTLSIEGAADNADSGVFTNYPAKTGTGALAIKGGYFPTEVAEADCATGYIPVHTAVAGKGYTVESGEIVARIGEVGYGSLSAALEAANTADTATTITIIKDIDETMSVFDVTPHVTFTADSPVEVKLHDTTLGAHRFFFRGGATFAQNVTWDANGTTSAPSGFVTQFEGNTTINGTTKFRIFRLVGNGVQGVVSTTGRLICDVEVLICVYDGATLTVNGSGSNMAQEQIHGTIKIDNDSNEARTNTVILNNTYAKLTGISVKAQAGTEHNVQDTFNFQVNNSRIVGVQGNISLGDSAATSISLTNSTLTYEGADIALAAGQTVTMDATSSITAKTWTNNGTVNVDVTNLAAADLPHTIVTVTGGGETTMGTINLQNNENDYVIGVDGNDIVITTAIVELSHGGTTYNFFYLADAIAKANELGGENVVTLNGNTVLNGGFRYWETQFDGDGNEIGEDWSTYDTIGAIIDSNASVTLNLNGHDIVGYVPGVMIYNDGTLVVNGEGHVYSVNTSGSGRHAIYNYGTVIINGGTFGDADDDMTNDNPYQRGNALYNYGTATINGGKFTAINFLYNNQSVWSYAVSNGENGVMVINNATAYGKTNGLVWNSGTMTIKDGSYTLSKSPTATYNYQVVGTGDDSVTYIKGGTFNHESVGGEAPYALRTLNTAKIYVSGGDFYYNKAIWGNWGYTGTVFQAIGGTYSKDDVNPKIPVGLFDDPSTTAADAKFYTLKSIPNDRFKVIEDTDVIAYIGEGASAVRYYAFGTDKTTENSAAKARTNDDTVIHLYKNVPAAYTLSEGETLKVELNGKTLTVTHDATKYGADSVQSETADGVTTYSYKTMVAEVNGVKYPTLAAAVEAVPANGTPTTITMLADETLSTYVSFPVGKTITLDLAGYTIEGDANSGGNCALDIYGDVTVKDTGRTESEQTVNGSVKGGTTVWVNNGGKFTLESGAIDAEIRGDEKATGILVEGNGQAILNGGTVTSATWGVTAWDTATVTVDGATVIGINDAAISTNGNAGQGATVNVTGGTITSQNDIAVYVPSGTLNVSGGTITGATAVYFKSTNLNITGGNLIANGTATAYSYNGNGANATGDALVIDNCGYPNGISSISVKGGYFESANAQPIASYANGQEGGVDRTPKTKFVSAVLNDQGVITSAPSFNKQLALELCADGFMPSAENTTTHKYTVELGTPVVIVSTPNGDSKYYSVEDATVPAQVGAALVTAVAAAQDGDTVTLLADASLTASLTIDKGITLEAKKSETENYSITGNKNPVVNVTDEGDVTVKNVVIESTHSSGDAIWLDDSYSGTFTLEGASLKATRRGLSIYNIAETSVVNVKDSSITMKGIADLDNSYNSGDTRGIAFSSDFGGFTTNIQNTVIKGFAYALNVYSGSCDMSVNVEGGTIVGRAALNVHGSDNTFTLNGVTIRGLNNEAGPTESFACIVDDYDASGNTYILTNVTTTANIGSGVPATSSATEYFFRLGGVNAEVEIKGNTSYSINAPARGGLEEYIENGWVADTENEIYMDQTSYANLKYLVDENEAYTVRGTTGSEPLDWTIGQADVVAAVHADGTTLYSFYYTVQEAIDDVGDDAGYIVELWDDVTEAVTIGPNQNLVFDLNECTLSGRVTVNGGTVVIQDEGMIKGRLDSYDGATVTLADDAMVDGTVVVWGDGTYGESGCKTPTLNVYGTVIRSANVFNGLPGLVGDESTYELVTTNGTDMSKPVINVYDGAVINGGSNIIGIYLPSGELNIAGGTITGPTAVYIKSGTITISGGTLTGNGAKADYSYNGNGCNPTGDALVVDSCNYPGDAATVTISGTPTIFSQHNCQIGYYVYQNSNLAEVTATSKTLTLPAGYAWKETETAGVYEVVGAVARIGSMGYATLKEAFDAVNDDETITLLQNVTVERTSNNSDKSFTLDLGGKTYTGRMSFNVGTVTVKNGAIVGRLDVYDSSVVTLAVDANVTGQVVVWGDGTYGETGCKTPTLNVEGTVTNTGDSAITTNGTDTSRANIKILDGAVVTSTDDIAVYLPSGNLSIEGGTVIGATAVYAKSGTVSISGGTLKATGNATPYNFYGNGAYATGDALVVDNCNYPNGVSSVSITGGTFTSDKAAGIGSYAGNGETALAPVVTDEMTEKPNITLTAGTAWGKNANGKYEIVEAVAKIGDVYYATLAEAIAAAPKNATAATTIELLKDTTEGTLAFNGGRNIVLDLGNHTLTPSFLYVLNGTLEVKNGTIAGTVYVYPLDTASSGMSSSFTLAAGATVEAAQNGIILYNLNGTDKGYDGTININGTVKGNVWVMGNFREGNSVVNVTGTVDATGKSDVGIALNGLATVNVNTGAVVKSEKDGKGTGIEVRAGTLNVNGGTITGTGEYTVVPNGSGTTTTGAGIAVAQHTTALPVQVNLNGGTITGTEVISVADPQNVGKVGTEVQVEANKGFVDNQATVLPEGYCWVPGTEPNTYVIGGAVAVVYNGTTYVGSYMSLAEAVAAASTTEQSTIKLLKNVDLPSALTVDANKNIVLDLNGKTISAERGALDVYGKLEVTDNSDDANGKITAKRWALWTNAGATVTLTKGTVEADSGVVNNTDEWAIVAQGANAVVNVNGGKVHAVYGNAISGIGNSSDSGYTIVVNGGEVISDNDVAIYHPNGTGLTINGGKVQGTTAIYQKAGTLTITGGQIIGTGAHVDYSYNGDGCNATGDAIVVDSCNYPSGKPTTVIAPAEGKTVSIVANGANTCAIGYYESNKDQQGWAAGDVKAYTDQLSIPDGYCWVASGNEYVLTEAVASITKGEPAVTTYYATLAEAVEAAESGDTIVMVKDLTGEAALTERVLFDKGEGVALTLDLNGHNITSSSNLSLASGALSIVNNGDPEKGVITTTHNGMAPVDVRSYLASGEKISKRTLTIGSGVTLDGTCYGLNVFGTNSADANNIEVNINGKVDGMVFVLGNLTNQSNTIAINVNDGAVIDASASTGEEAIHSGIALNGYATVTVAEGASVKGETGIEVRDGQLTVTGGTIEGTAAPTAADLNNNGTTVKGAGIAVAPYDANRKPDVSISGNTTVKGHTALYIGDPNGVHNVNTNVEVTGGTFLVQNGGSKAVDVADEMPVSNFISGGTFSSQPDAEYVVESKKPSEADPAGLYTVIPVEYRTLVLSSEPVGNARVTEAEKPDAQGTAYLERTSVTVTVDNVGGYNFVGWFDAANEKVSTSLTYTFDMPWTNEKENDSLKPYKLTARFDVNSTRFNLTVTADLFTVKNTQVDVFFNNYEQEGTFMQDVPGGSNFTIKYTGDKEFLYWRNESNKIVSTSIEYSFTLNSNTKIEAVVKNSNSVLSMVYFVSEYGQVLSAINVPGSVDAESIIVPNDPIRPGYTFAGWKVVEGAALDRENVPAAVVSYVQNHPGKPVKVTPVFDRETVEVTLTFVIDGVSTEYPIAMAGWWEMKAPESSTSGKTFMYWIKGAEGDNIISYSNKVVVYVDESSNDTYTAVYGDGAPAVDSSKFIYNLIGGRELSGEMSEGKYVVQFISVHGLPDSGYTVTEFGAISTTDPTIGNSADNSDTFVLGASNVKEFAAVTASNSDADVHTHRITPGRTVYFRGYVSYIDSTGELYTVYSPIQYATAPNPNS